MRGRIFYVLAFLFFCVFQVKAQTTGTLTVTVTTAQTATGTFAPRNILAIWIEDGSGKFVKTLLAYANTRKTYLNTWEASTTTAGSAYNSVDAITGATQSTHGTRTCSWNGTDYSGKAVADGSYKVRMELTDQNATGNTASFTFTKGTTNQNLTLADVLPSFKAIKINWSTTVTSINPGITQSNAAFVFPNPGSGTFTVLAESVSQIQVFSISGELILKGNTPVFDLNGKPNGIYFVKILTGSDTVIKKVIKN